LILPLLLLAVCAACPFNRRTEPDQRKLLAAITASSQAQGTKAQQIPSADVAGPWSRPGVLPAPLDMGNNAFISTGLEKSTAWGATAAEYLLETLAKFQETRSDDLCYWSYQPNPPPIDGPSLLHPYRKPSDVQDGHLDDDVEWGQALAQVAVSRLHSLVKPGGPVVNAMCASGSELAKRRCATDFPKRANTSKCVDPILNQELRWPTAVAIFRVGHPDLASTIRFWRSNASGHAPNIQWVYGAGSQPTQPWNNNGSLPTPGDLDPPGMPQGAPYPSSKGVAWGLSPGLKMLAKVVPCASIPAEYLYPSELFFCEHLRPGENTTSADHGYEMWRSLESVWPPTKPCEDDVPKLNAILKELWLPLGIPPWDLPLKSCAEAKNKLGSLVPNWGCDTPNSPGLSFRDVCCSICGNTTMQVFPPPPPPSPPSPGYTCKVCKHVYDADRDGGGLAFEDLPDTWVCPQCGAGKSAYKKTAANQWAHDH